MPVVSAPLAWQGFALLLTGAVLRAVYVLNNKRNLRRASARFLVVVNMLGTAAILAVAMALFAPPRIQDWFSWQTGILWPLIATALLNLVVQFGEHRALELEDASLVTPMAAAAPLFSVLAGLFILRELPTPAGWVGVALLSIGSYVLTASKPAVDGAAVGVPPGVVRRHLHTLANLLLPWHALRRSRGMRLALAGALAAGVSINFDKIVAVRSNALFVTAAVFGFVGLTVLCTLKREHLPKRLAPREIVAIAATPVILSVMAVLVVSAFFFGLASHNSALKRIYILFVALLAGAVLKERGHPERVWGGAIMAVGAVLLAF